MTRLWAPLAVFALFLVVAVVAGEGVSTGEEISPGGSGNIQSIEIRGNNRIEEQTIRARLKSAPGQPLSGETVREDIKSVYGLGFFQDVRVEVEEDPGGPRLIFEVAERPILSREPEFIGNAAILSDKIKERTTVKKGVFLDDSKVKGDAEQIRTLYEEDGYYNTVVIPVLRVKGEEVALAYYIKEGAQAKIKKIRFDGAEKMREKILKKSILSKEYSVFSSWMTRSGFYKEGVLEEDAELLKDQYLNKGYLQVQVGAPSVDFRDLRSMTVVPYPILHGELDFPYEFHSVQVSLTYPLIEGEQFHLRSLSFRGNKKISQETLEKELNLAKGDLFRRDVLRQGVAKIHDLYGEEGHLFAQVVPEYDVDEATRTVDLVVSIDEDRPMKVRRISITGNEKTRDKVVRREVRVDETDRVNTKLLRRSFQRINNLNFFESIEISPARVGSDEVDLGIRVKEKSTGALSIGGGYSSVDRFVALAEITQGNLFGRGQLIRARAEAGGRRNTYSFTFREPYLFDKPVSGTVSAFNQVRDFNSYQERRIGGNLILGKSFSEYISGSLSYTIESLDIFDIDRLAAPSLIIDQAGRTVTSSVGNTLAYDSRDFIFDPSKGTNAVVSAEYAGTFLGGDNNFVKGIFDLSQFFPLPFGTVFSAHGKVGLATGIQGRALPVGERFFVGGINSVRGFDFGEAGPIDEKTGEIIGGSKELIFNLEFLFPLVEEAKIKGVFFYDAGRGFDDGEPINIGKLRTSAGAGIRWVSPIGPLRLEWGRKLYPAEGEDKSNVEFTIGTLF